MSKSTKTGGESTRVEFNLPVEIDAELLEDFPREVARKYGVIPLARLGGKSLILAADGELSAKDLKHLRREVGLPIHVISGPRQKLESTVEQVFNGEGPEIAAGEAEGPRGSSPQQSRSPLSAAEEEPWEALPEGQPAPPSEDRSEVRRILEEEYVTEPRTLSDLFVDLGFLSREQLEGFLAESGEEEDQNGSGKASAFDASAFIDEKVLRLIPESAAREYRILPLLTVDSELLLAAAAYLDSTVMGELQKMTGLTPKLVITDAEDLESSIEGCYRRKEQLITEEMRLGEFLLAKGLINQEQLDGALAEQAHSKEKLGELLVRRGYVTEDDIYTYLALRAGYEFRRFLTSDIDVELSKTVSQKFAERNLVLPLALDQENRVLEVAMAEPYDLKVLDTLKSIMGHRGYEIKPVLSSPSNIKEGISYSYNFREMFDDELEFETMQAEEDDRQDLVATEDIPQIRKIINQILYRAVVEGASDVHIENLQNRVRVRFRLDGLLQERKTSITKENIRSVCSVFKVDSGLDITEQRRSQDGVFKMRIGQDRYVDFRINLHATEFGQDAVIRILDTSKNLMPLEGLGLPSKMLQSYIKLVENPQGLILFAGPTGSGKSTTLYSTLAHLNGDEVKIVTAEDPVEYYLDGICQYKINEAIGNTFAEYGRRFLRKDPDIILIGEIRDEATAAACIKAAGTGHLVFSTLHTNDSVGVVPRLRQFGVAGSDIGEVLLAVISQRLTRRVCKECVQPYVPDPALLELFYPEGAPAGVRFMHGAGCAACDYLGYKGRIGLYEYWELNPEVVLAIVSGERDVRKIARRTGLMSLVGDGLKKVEKGITTLEELRRVVPLEQIRSYTHYFA